MTSTRSRRRLVVILAVLAGLAILVLARPTLHLIRSYLRDRGSLPPVAAGMADDASRLNASAVKEIWHVPGSSSDAEEQLVDLIRRTGEESLPVSIAGARHSLGGHTIAPDGVVIDMLPFRKMSLSGDGEILLVQAGALWTEVIHYLDPLGRSIDVMQSDASFSVGGSLSVNVHGWQVRCPPIAASVKSFRLLLADGRIVRCSREENQELFHLALGGYGLFGVILDVELWTVPNEIYSTERIAFDVDQFASIFRESVDGDDSVQMAYGRLRVTKKGFLDDGILTLHHRGDDASVEIPSIAPTRFEGLERTVFRGSVGSDYGKRLRWELETLLGEKIGGRFLSRNQLLDGDVSLYVNRREGQTDILHEYFIPLDSLGAFLKVIKEAVPRHDADLLNVTLRDVRKDVDTLLRYADRDLIAVVMFFDQKKGGEAEIAMRDLTRELIDASLDLGGRYYLPYRPHATSEQFAAAYPQALAFAREKIRVDPEERFTNRFWLGYLRPLVSTDEPPLGARRLDTVHPD